MKRIKVLFINVIILTATSLLMRTIGISFQVYLSNKIGSAGVGLLHLILSVYFLSITFATSGIRLATTRLVAEEIGVGRNFGAIKAVRNCVTYALFFSITFGITLFFASGYIGEKWICDSRSILSLKILAVSLPFIAVSSVFSGYFSAVRGGIKIASVQISEQIIKIAVTIIILMILKPKSFEYSCVAIVVGTCVGEISSFFLLYLYYKLDKRKHERFSKSSNNIVRRMFKIALPVALGAYVTSIIRTNQQLLIPIGLKKSGASSENAMATYGIIHGMVMPIIMFPSVLLDVIADLIVPELAESKAQGSKRHLNYMVSRVFNLGLLCSICVMSVFLRFSTELGMAIYDSMEAAYYIRIFAPIIPIMYLDTIVDSMLKGVGEQISSMRFNIIESALSLTMIYFLLPKYAINGFIFTMFLTKTFNFYLSVRKLIKSTQLHIGFANIIKSIICILISLFLLNLIIYIVGNVFGIYITSLTVSISITVLIYFALLRIFGCITYEDLVWVKTIFR